MQATCSTCDEDFQIKPEKAKAMNYSCNSKANDNRPYWLKNLIDKIENIYKNQGVTWRSSR